VKRSVDKLLDDILQAAEVAAEIVRRGRANFESDPVAQYDAEAAVGRIGDAIVVDHAYHRLDYGRVWNTLCEDIPRLRAAVERYRG
jgi:uncharacterized protein with HEPN domain